jgi:hypothetical protein
MPTSWKVQNKFSDSGPDWDALDTVSVDEWEDMTTTYWEWTRDWTLSNKASATDNWTPLATKGFKGSPWSNISATWANHDDNWLLYSWTIVTNTKTILGTET